MWLEPLPPCIYAYIRVSICVLIQHPCVICLAPAHTSVHLCIYPCTHPFTYAHPSMHQCTHPCTHTFIHIPIHPSMHVSMHTFFYYSYYSYPSRHPCTHPCAHLSIYAHNRLSLTTCNMTDTSVFCHLISYATTGHFLL